MVIVVLFAVIVMALLVLSKAEKQFIEDGIKENVRSDGRSRLDFRPFSLDTGVVSQANGSARLSMGVTEILVGVKCSIGTPTSEHPNWGRLELNVECNPFMNWDSIRSGSGGGGGGGVGSMALENQEKSQLVLTQHLTRIFSGDTTFNWESLQISKSHCWVLMVEALVLESGGNLVDALSIAIRAALADTKIPKISVVEGSHKGKVDQIEVSDDPRQYTRLPAVENFPITISILNLSSTTSNNNMTTNSPSSACYFVDPTLEEEACDCARLTVAVSSKVATLVGAQKLGSRVALRPEQLPVLVHTAQQIGRKLLQQIDRELQVKVNEVDVQEEIPHFGLTST